MTGSDPPSPTVPAAPSAPATRPRWYASLYTQVLFAVAAGVALGYLAPHAAVSLKPLGDAFIKLVRMIIGPVIFCTVASGIAGVRSLEKVGRVGLKAIGYFIVVSSLALVIGLAVANLAQPGAGFNADPARLDAGAIAGFQQQAHAHTVVDFLLHVIPDSLVSAFVGGDILQVLLVSVLFGLALALTGERAQPARRAVELLGAVIARVVQLIMRAAPLGALGSMAYTIGQYGIGALTHRAGLMLCYYLTSALFGFGILGAIARSCGFSLLRLLRYIRHELLLVLGTSSSESALPLLIDKLERAGCSRPVVGLVVPAGYSFNLDGTNIYMTMAALFIAQATNVHLALGDQLLLLVVAMISSKGAAGVTGSGFITLAATLAVVPSVPIAGLVLIQGVDRFMSECRSLTNFIGNAVAAIVIARWEGEVDAPLLRRTLQGGGHG
ncbi:MAG: dicarboxylate/amino acid:cation symporter [Gammaproteobacteria bacterium]|nr:dicarboxylate/amino acid:cation symporter [Gammaproteobacteria bacterium]